MRRIDGGVLAGGVILGLIGAWAAAEAWSYGLWRGRAPGEGLHPFGASLAVLALSGATVLGAFAGPSPATQAGSEGLADPPQWRKVGLYITGLVALAAFLSHLGYWLTTVAILVLILRVAEGLSWRVTLAVTLAASVFTHLVFERLLGLQLPSLALF